MSEVKQGQVTFMRVEKFADIDQLFLAWDGLGAVNQTRGGYDFGFGFPPGYHPENNLSVAVRPDLIKADSIWMRIGDDPDKDSTIVIVFPEWFTRGMWSLILKRDDDVKDGHYEAGYEAAQKAAAARADDMIEVEIPTDPVEEFRAIPWGSQDLGSVTLYAGVDGNHSRWALIGRVVESLHIWEIPEVLGAALTRKLDAQREGAYEAGRARGAQEATQRALNTMALGKASESKF